MDTEGSSGQTPARAGKAPERAVNQVIKTRETPGGSPGVCNWLCSLGQRDRA